MYDVQRDLKKIQFCLHDCDTCTPGMPGIRFPTCYDDTVVCVERCSVCDLYANDLDAAIAVGRMLGLDVELLSRYRGREHVPTLKGITPNEAEELNQRIEAFFKVTREERKTAMRDCSKDCRKNPCNLCRKQGRLDLFLQRFTLTEGCQNAVDNNDEAMHPAFSGEIAMAMSSDGGQTHDVALYSSLHSAFASAEENLADAACVVEQVCDLTTGDVYRPTFKLSFKIDNELSIERDEEVWCIEGRNAEGKWVDLTWDVGLAGCETARQAEDGRQAIIEGSESARQAEGRQDKPAEWNEGNTRIRLAREVMGVRRRKKVT